MFTMIDLPFEPQEQSDAAAAAALASWATAPEPAAAPARASDSSWPPREGSAQRSAR